jgi:hypothetical protein
MPTYLEDSTIYCCQKVNCYLREDIIDHGSRARDLSGCIVRPAATFVNYIYTIKIAE